MKANGASYWLRPSFIFSYMTGTVDELAYPLLLAEHGVPPWLLKIGFGHNDMFWYRLIERLGRNSLVGTTVRDSAHLPEHLVADEHHADWAGQKGYIPTTVGGGCILGVVMTASADDVHLQEAYGVFAPDAGRRPRVRPPDGQHRRLGVDAECVPDVVSPDHGGALFSARVLEDSRPLPQGPRTAPPGVGRLPCRYCEEFRRLMNEFQQWCATQTWTTSVREMLTKLWNKTESYVVAYEHPGCHRTSNAVDRPMNRLCRLMYASRGLHGHQSSSEFRLGAGPYC